MRMIRNIIFMVMLSMMLSSCFSTLDYLIRRSYDPEAKFEMFEEDWPKIKEKPKLSKKEKKKKQVKDKLDAAYPSLGN